MYGGLSQSRWGWLFLYPKAALLLPHTLGNAEERLQIRVRYPFCQVKKFPDCCRVGLIGIKEIFRLYTEILADIQKLRQGRQ